MFISRQRCDMGGGYWHPQIPGPAVCEEPCAETVTHRYRSRGMVEGHWSHRCAKHVGILNAPELVVEPLPAEQASSVTRPKLIEGGDR